MKTDARISNNGTPETLGKSGKSKAKGKAKKPVGKERFHVSHFINPSGEEVFRVAGYKPNGERVRENWQTNEEAIGRKAELDIEAANIVTTTSTRLKATRLTDEQVKDAERAVAKLGSKSVLESIGSKSMLEAVEYFVANYREPVRQMNVADAVVQFI